MNRALSNYPNNGVAFTGVAIALFAFITVYYILLYFVTGKSLSKLIVTYSLVIILLITIILISKYYTVLYEGFIADYVPESSVEYSNISEQKNINKRFPFSKTPFSELYNVDKMCETSSDNKVDHDNISWKCRVRKIFKPDTFSLKTSANEVPDKMKFPLKYDGIYEL